MRSELEDLRSQLGAEVDDDAEAVTEDEAEDVTEPTVVFKFAGTGATDQESRDFTVVDTWEFHWESVGTGLSPVLELFNSNRARYSVDDWDLGPAKSGKVLVRRGGTFFFKMNLYKPGPWKITVLDVPG
ncbi:MAG: hypothetical protein ABR575_02085 [Actinomycetota bacterium]